MTEIMDFEGYGIRTNLEETVLEAAKLYEGLPEGVSKPIDLIKPIKQIGKAGGFKEHLISHLEYLLLRTRPQDWSSTSRPIIYKSRTTIARDRQISSKQVGRIERELHRLGVLVWRDSANFHRGGSRDYDDAIEDANGIDLSPLAVFYEGFRQRAAEINEENKQWKRTKTRISTLRREIAAHFHYIHGTTLEILHGRFEALRQRITESTPIGTLKKILEGLRQLSGEVMEAATAQKTEEQHVNMSSTEDVEVLPYNTNNTKSFYKKDTSNPPVDKKMSAANAAQKKTSQFNAGFTSTGLNGSRKKEMGIFPDLVTPSMAYQAASNLFRHHIPDEGRLTWEDIIQAAQSIVPHLGIHKTAWNQARAEMGGHEAALCVLIADKRQDDELNPVRKPGGFLRGCIRQYERGELHTHKSIFGILKKQEKEQLNY